MECYCSQEFEKLIKSLQPKVDRFHKHSSVCGHMRIIHGDHIDYIVDGYLHHPHKTHCDNHGPVEILNGYILHYYP